MVEKKVEKNDSFERIEPGTTKSKGFTSHKILRSGTPKNTLSVLKGAV